METKNDDIFNLSDNVSDFLKDRKTEKNDGLLRIDLSQGRDNRREITLRLLPNFTKEKKLSSTAIEKHLHYANFKSNPELSGYFDCLKNANIGKDCPLCNTFWTLKNDKNPANQDKAKLINRSTKYYAYCLVVEDKQVPENEGKIFVFPFGFKIYQKIKAKAENSKKPIKVEDLVHGANLNLVVQEVGGFYNYDASEFDYPEPITINGKQLKVDAEGRIPSSERERVMEFLSSRNVELESFLPKDWSPEQYDKANKIVALLSGVSYNNTSSDADFSAYKKEEKKTVLTSSDVFGNDENEQEKKVEKAKTRASAFFNDAD